MDSNCRDTSPELEEPHDNGSCSPGDDFKEDLDLLPTVEVDGDQNCDGHPLDPDTITEPTDGIPKGSTKGWLDILGSGDLMKKVCRPCCGPRPDKGSIVTVNMVGKLDDGSIIDEKLGFSFYLGDVEVVPGLDIAIPLMHEGEVSEIVVKPRFGYGTAGRKPNIPPNSTITYEIELLKIEEEPDIESMTMSDRKAIGDRKRDQGNFWYEQGEYGNALTCYRRSLEYLDCDNSSSGSSVEELQNLLENRIKVYNNMAAAQLKIEAYEAALKSVENVLKLKPNNVKALYRKAKILSIKHETKEAIQVLQKALKLEPESKVIAQELNLLLSRKKTETDREKQMYKRMLGQGKSCSAPRSSRTNGRKFATVGVILGSIAVAIMGVATYKHFQSAV